MIEPDAGTGGQGPDESGSIQKSVLDEFEKLPEEEKVLVGEIIRLEQSKIHLALPRGVKQDIVDVVKRLIK